MSERRTRRSARLSVRKELSEKATDRKHDDIIGECSQIRKSSRTFVWRDYQERSDSESPKKSRSKQNSTSAGKTSIANGEVDTTFDKELANVSEDSAMAPELFGPKDVDGKALFPIGTPPKTSVMNRRSTVAQNEHDMKSVEMKIAKIAIQKCKTTGGWKKIEPVPSFHNGSSTALSTQNGMRKRSIVKSENDHPQMSIRTKTETTAGKFDSDNKENKKLKSANVPEDCKNGSSTRVLRPRKVTVQDHHFESDLFFERNSEKARTSKNTLNKLRNRHLDEENLRKLLEKKDYIPMEHKIAIERLTADIKREYSEWLHVMKEGFNILLYGLGSKRLLINDFFKEMIHDEPTLIVNGFFPSLTLKEILDDIIITLLGLQTVSSQSECFNIIEKTMRSNPDRCIYLLIHNIDGGMLRSSKTQDVLSRLASIRNVHLVASVDHINAPLIWDSVKRERFNFYWITATTFLPYEAETSYEGSLLVQKNGALALMSLQNVFASLTPNAKSIYIILVKYLLESNENSQSGMAFKDLYRAAREGFLVSSDQALRSQLTEFIDHKLVRQRRNDGIETLAIPLDKSLLKQFLEHYEEKSK